jgi:flagellar hook protein FlgE
MIDALFNGISGLNGFQTGLNTQSNNMSNINTIGFKADQISFADQMYQLGVGRGVQVDEIKKDFSQGTLKITGNNFDMALEGKGYFMVQGDTEEVLFTRAGNFRMAEDGYLKNANDFTVKGLNTITQDVLSTDTTTIFTNDYTKLITSNISQNVNDTGIQTFNAKTTDYNLTATNDPDENSGNNYKTKQSKILDIEGAKNAFESALLVYANDPLVGTTPTNQISTISFDETAIGGNDLVELTVGYNTIRVSFDTDGNTTLKNLANEISELQSIQASYVQDATTGDFVFTVESMIPGREIVVDNPRIKRGNDYVTPLPTVTTTLPVSGSGYEDVLAKELALKEAVETAGAKYLRINSTIDETGTTVGDIQMNLSELGLSTSPFGDFEMDDGYLYMKQDENRFIVGKLQTAVFANELGLEPQGGNLYSATLESGEAVLATNENKILSNTLELANSELGESLVDLMVYQRAFEASSKSISTSDEFLKTAIALKK